MSHTVTYNTMQWYMHIYALRIHCVLALTFACIMCLDTVKGTSTLLQRISIILSVKHLFSFTRSLLTVAKTRHTTWVTSRTHILRPGTPGLLPPSPCNVRPSVKTVLSCWRAALARLLRCPLLKLASTGTLKSTWSALTYSTAKSEYFIPYFHFIYLLHHILSNYW